MKYRYALPAPSTKRTFHIAMAAVTVLLALAFSAVLLAIGAQP